MNKDPQYIESKRILNEIPFGVTQVFKTTRNGATTGLIANCVDAGLKVMLIADTNKIAIETLNKAIKYTNWKSADVENIPGMWSCIINKQRVENNPDLSKLSYLPTPNCLKCDKYDKCLVTSFLRCNNWDVVGLTHAKLHVLMNSHEGSYNDLVVDKLLKEVDIIIIDETDKIPTNFGSSIQVYPIPNLSKFDKLLNNKDSEYKEPKYKSIIKFINIFNNIRNHYGCEIKQLIKYNEEIKLMKYPLLNIDSLLFDENKNMTINDINYRSNVGGAIVGLMLKRSNYDLSTNDVIYLSKINDVLSGNDLTLQYLGVTDKKTVNLISNSGLTRSFKKFARLFNNKKIILTTATFGNYNYSKIFGNIHKVIMDDINGTIKMMTYIPDTYNISMMDYWRINDDIPSKNFKNRIIAAVYHYYTQHDDIVFVTMTKGAAYNIEKWVKDTFDINISVDYYGSDNMRGVECRNRKMCCIGMPVLPKNTYDVMCDSVEESTKMRISQTHGTYQQATGRVKDPMGINDSIIFNIGITEDILNNVLVSGTNRDIVLNQVITYTSDPNMCIFGNKCIDVSVDDPLEMPKIVSEDEVKLVKLINKHDGVIRTKLRMNRRISAKRLDELLEMDYVKDRIVEEVMVVNNKLLKVYRLKEGVKVT